MFPNLCSRVLLLFFVVIAVPLFAYPALDEVLPQGIPVDEFTGDVVRYVFAGVNETRRRSGLLELKYDARLTYSTYFSAKYQFETRTISHNYWNSGCTKREFFDAFGNQDVPGMWGENAAMGYFNGQDARAVAAQWLSMWRGSSPHLAAILQPGNVAIGVGHYGYTGQGPSPAYATLLFAMNGAPAATGACPPQIRAIAHRRGSVSYLQDTTDFNLF